MDRTQKAEYIDALFSQEATNASGNAKARLVVDGHDFGQFIGARRPML